MNKVIYAKDGTQRFYDDTRLIGLIGVNKQGKIGYFFDTENGLCAHESAPLYCTDCKKIGLEYLEEIFLD